MTWTREVGVAIEMEKVDTLEIQFGDLCRTCWWAECGDDKRERSMIDGGASILKNTVDGHEVPEYNEAVGGGGRKGSILATVT